MPEDGVKVLNHWATLSNDMADKVWRSLGDVWV